MSSNIFALMSDDYLISTALQRDNLTDLERELVKRLEAALVANRRITDEPTGSEPLWT
jgi:hypothetical protein